MTIEIVSGNDISQLFQIHKNDVVFNIPNTATVIASIVSEDLTIVYAGPFTLLDTDDGADWPNSLVSLIVAKTETVGIGSGAGKTRAKIEIQVDDIDEESWLFDVKIVKGTIV